MNLDPASDHGPDPEPGSTAYLLQEMQLFGHRPFDDEPDARPLPDARIAGGAIVDMFDALAGCLEGTRIEPDLEDLLWNLVQIFHRAGERVERELDGNEQEQKRMQREQDGSEIGSVELERMIAEGITLVERRDAMEFFREAAADRFRIHTRKAWTPRTGSRTFHRELTAAAIDSRDFLDRRLRERAAALLPEGVRIAFTGGAGSGDHQAIWQVLDKARALPGHGPVARRDADRRRTGGRLLGRRARRAPGAFPPRLESAPQRGPLQAQRRDARGVADRCHHIPGYRHSGQSGGQGPQTRHRRLGFSRAHAMMPAFPPVREKSSIWT